MRATCTLCASTEATLVHDGAGHARDVMVWRCTPCGHHFQGGWAAAFEEDLYRYYDRFQCREEVYSPLNASRHLELLARFETQTRGRRLLDVGCGAGQFVADANAAGWDALGIDLSQSGVDCCNRFGVPARCVDFHDPSLDHERFDVIFMSELIEHVPDPVRFVARAAHLLEPGGVLYVTTPNYDAVTRRLLGGEWSCIDREHLSYFTPRTLRDLLGRQPALEIVSLTTRNIAVLTLVSGLRRAVSRADARVTKGEGASLGTARQSDQALRRRIAESATLGRLRDGVNWVLSATGTGETLVLLARRVGG